MGHLQRGHIYREWFYARHCASEIVNGESKRVQWSHRSAVSGGKLYFCDYQA